MSIKKENSKEARINLLLTQELRKKYKIHCAKKDIGMSERIRELIENDLKGWVQISQKEYLNNINLADIE